MDIIHVNASVQYDIMIGRNLLPEAGERIKSLGNIRRALVVSDDHVDPLYGDTLLASLQDAGILTDRYVFPHGEASKSLSNYGRLMEYISTCHLTRSDILVALGGGVVGDLTGFAAATYQRGIRYVQIPTTLLAAVDSSVGGKTAINLETAKNQAGCFHQPSLVICDIETLQTLPEEEYRNGCAEVIKYGMIGNPEFLQQLSQKPVKEFLEEVITVCVSMKRDVVMRDEFDTGERMLLNFGHTLGHGAEKCSGYQLPHGYGVAMGMAVITECAEQAGICEKGTSQYLNRILEKYELPTSIPYPMEEVLAAVRSDKKNTSDTMRIIVPLKAGSCVVKSMKEEELRAWLQLN